MRPKAHRNLTLMPMLASFTLLSAAAAHAADDDTRYSGWYGGLRVGTNVSQDLSFENESTGLEIDTEQELGVNFGGFAGYQREDWRFEFDYTRRRNSYNTISATGPGAFGLTEEVDGTQSSHAFTFNVYKELTKAGEWDFWAGLGGGVAQLDTGVLRAGTTLVADDTDWRGVVQGTAFLSRDLSDELELAFGYRYFRSLGSDFDFPLGNESESYVHHDLFAHLSWKFDSPKSKPRRAEPAPRPAPAPAPKPAPVPEPAPIVKQAAPEPAPEPKPAPLPGPFLIFFDFDESVITPEAERILRAAADAYKSGGDVRIVINGHADRSGPSGYNVRLSERRAMAAQTYLQQLGVDASGTEIKFFGEAQPLVETNDGVREPQNRRAEIILNR